MSAVLCAAMRPAAIGRSINNANNIIMFFFIIRYKVITSPEHNVLNCEMLGVRFCSAACRDMKYHASDEDVLHAEA